MVDCLDSLGWVEAGVVVAPVQSRQLLEVEGLQSFFLVEVALA